MSVYRAKPTKFDAFKCDWLKSSVFVEAEDDSVEIITVSTGEMHQVLNCLGFNRYKCAYSIIRVRVIH